MQEATIKILTPATSNGLLNVIDAAGQMVFTETIVPAGQRAFYEKLNAKLPDNLKHRFAEVKEEPVQPPQPSAQELRIAELEAKLAEATAAQKPAKTVKNEKE